MAGNYYSPRVVTGGYGEGLAQGMDNFTKLVSMGLTHNANAKSDEKRWAREDARQSELWERQDRRQSEQWAREDSRQTQQWGRADSKELATKTEEADYAAGAWASIKAELPDMITPEMNDKFVSGSLGTKRGMLTQANAAAERRREEMERARRSEMSRETYPIEMPNGQESSTHYQTGNGQVMPYPVEKPRAGFNDMGGGMGVLYGPDGRPVDPDNVLKYYQPDGQGPPMMGPAFETPGTQKAPPRLIKDKDKDGNVRFFNPHTGQEVGSEDPVAKYFQAPKKAP